MILAFANSLFLKLAGFLLSGLLFITGAAPAAPAAPIEAKDPESVELQFSVVADVHMETYTLFRFRDFAQVLTDMASAKQRQDALVLVGDNTMNGQITEYIMLYGLLSRYDSSKNFLMAMGNHDLNQSTYETSAAIRRHNFFLRSYTGAANDKPYYNQMNYRITSAFYDGGLHYQIENPYTFIILGDEDPQEDTTATISQIQLDWLAATLEKALKGYPIFIFLHQQLGHTFAWEWGGVGEQSEAIREIIEQYENVFFFNGHLHRPFEVKEIGGVTYVNLPTLLSGAQTGIGCQVEAYEDRVVLRARDYVAGEWLDEYSFDVYAK
ncbi:MAG: metallophosphoesterase [Oscillospiraceae bacterium]|nr:metallophosphoesterase [Oscillospiraceae bacterium]